MNFHSDEWIKENLERHYQEALTLFPKEQILGVFLQGSQNYGLDYEDSDIDTKAVIIPTLAEIAATKKPVSTTHVRHNDEHIDLKDIRLMIGEFKKQNLNFLEILWTPYFIINPKYAQEWGRLVCAREDIANYCPGRVVKSMKGIAMEKFHALEHRYPSRIEWLDKFGYDPKQLHHLLRIENFIEQYNQGWAFESCFYPDSETSQWLVRVKTGEEYDLVQAREKAEAAKNKITRLTDSFCTEDSFECDPKIEKLFSSVQENILKLGLIQELNNLEPNYEQFLEDGKLLKDYQEAQAKLGFILKTDLNKGVLDRVNNRLSKVIADQFGLDGKEVKDYFINKVCFKESFYPIAEAWKHFSSKGGTK